MAIIPVVDQVQLRELRSGISPFYFGEWGGVSPIIPNDAVIFYSFDYGILEWVNQETSVLTIRDSETNVVQLDSSMTTYPSGGAAIITGESMLVEGIATTQTMKWTEDLTQAIWLERGTGTVDTTTVTSPKTGLYMFELTVGADGVDDVRQIANGAFSASVALAASVFFKKHASYSTGTALLRNTAGSPLGSWEIDLSLIGDGIERLTEYHAAVTVVDSFVSAGTGNGGLRFASDSGTIKYYAWGGNLCEGGLSSYVKAEGAVTTRVACQPTISSLIEQGAFREVPSNSVTATVLGDYTSGGWTNGLFTNGSIGTVGYLQSSGVTGKYYSYCTANDVGCIYTSLTNNVKLRITGYVNVSSLQYEVIYNPTGLADDVATQAGFENTGDSSNVFTIDWSLSLKTEAEVITIRTTVGDSNVWPAAEEHPANDFIWEGEFQYLGAEGTGSPSFGIGSDTTDRLWVYVNSTDLKGVNLVQSTTAFGSKFVILNFGADVEYGDWISWKATKDSAVGIEFEATNITQALTDSGNDTSAEAKADLTITDRYAHYSRIQGGTVMNQAVKNTVVAI